MKDLSPQLILSDARGVWIPKNFVDEFDLNKWVGITIENHTILADGPDSELYWEAWTEVTDNAYHRDENGDIWRLYQDGNVFLICDAWVEEQIAVDNQYRLIVDCDERGEFACTVYYIDPNGEDGEVAFEIRKGDDADIDGSGRFNPRDVGDWRTYIANTPGNADCVVLRANEDPEMITRMENWVGV